MNSWDKDLNLCSCVRLNNGVDMPRLGLGVYLSQPGTETYQAVRAALAAGYRHIDTATFYQNEGDVGRAIKDSLLPREQLFITTKVWNDGQGYRPCWQAIERSLELLQSAWIDLYLIHWPIKRLFADTWRAMSEAYQRGLLRALGVSNFTAAHLLELAPTPVYPAVNQVECHPDLQQWDLQRFCQQQGVVLAAWRPLLAGGVGKMPVLQQLADKYGKSPFQIAIRWQLQRGNVVLPKSVKAERIVSNAEVFDFGLSLEDMAQMARLDCGQRRGKDPDLFSYGS